MQKKEVVGKLFEDLEIRSANAFSNLNDKFNCLMQVSEATGIRIPNGKLDGITSFGALKEFVIEQMDKRSKTLGNPIEELYDFREPPSNMRIVQYRNYASGGPIVIKD